MLQKWNHLPCLAHTMNLITWDALKGQKPILDKVREVVDCFHRSTLGAEKLKASQRQMGMAELWLKRDCITRWNSTYGKLKSFLQSKDTIISTLAVKNASVIPLLREEWTVVLEVCTILEPFLEVTEEISGEGYVIPQWRLVSRSFYRTRTQNYQIPNYGCFALCYLYHIVWYGEKYILFFHW